MAIAAMMMATVLQMGMALALTPGPMPLRLPQDLLEFTHNGRDGRGGEDHEEGLIGAVSMVEKAGCDPGLSQR